MVSSGKKENSLLHEFHFNKISTQFLTTFANTLWRSLRYVPKLLEASILDQPLASRPNGPEPPLFLIAAFLITSSSIDWNLTG